MYGPGEVPSQSIGYSTRQQAKWEILSDMAHALNYGYIHTRMTMPGQNVSWVIEHKYRMKKVETAWDKESGRDSGTRGLPASILPMSQQIYYSLRLEACEKVVEPESLELSPMYEAA